MAAVRVSGSCQRSQTSSSAVRLFAFWLGMADTVTVRSSSVDLQQSDGYCYCGRPFGTTLIFNVGSGAPRERAKLQTPLEEPFRWLDQKVTRPARARIACNAHSDCMDRVCSYVATFRALCPRARSSHHLSRWEMLRSEPSPQRLRRHETSLFYWTQARYASLTYLSSDTRRCAAADSPACVNIMQQFDKLFVHACAGL
jgi:hypothetical protein